MGATSLLNVFPRDPLPPWAATWLEPSAAAAYRASAATESRIVIRETPLMTVPAGTKAWYGPVSVEVKRLDGVPGTDVSWLFLAAASLALARSGALTRHLAALAARLA